MKVMILAAGRGQRMMPLTANTPKPLLEVQGLSIIERNITQLKHNGFNDIVINTAYLGSQIENKLGDGSSYRVNIIYSQEKNQKLETAGGVINALPLLGNEPFLVINGDTLNNYPLKKIKSLSSKLGQDILAHLILVPNPAHNAQGDFDIDKHSYLQQHLNHNPYTFSGIGVYHPDFFKPHLNQRQTLYPLLQQGIKDKHISAEVFKGFWCDIGTPKRLNELQSYPITLLN